MSRAEEITSEVRKLVMTCRAMEAQLQQSISKKAHQEIVAKMQGTIDGLNADLEKTRLELSNTVSVGERVSSLSTQITSQESTFNSLSAQISSQREAIEAHGKAIELLGTSISTNNEALGAKLAKETVPVLLYNETLSRIGELEEKIRFMVERSEHVELQKRCDELTEKLTTMVPTADYLALQSQFVNYVPKSQFEEAQRVIASSVLREEFAKLEAHSAELESRLSNSISRKEYENLQAHAMELEERVSNSVPKSDYEELTAKIASLAKEASVSTISLDDPVSQSVPEAIHPTVEPAVTVPQEPIQVTETVQAVAPVVDTPTQAPSEPAPAPAQVDSPTISHPIQEVAPAPVEASPAPVEVPQTSSQATLQPEQLTSAPEVAPGEISEVQSNLSEIQGVTESGQSSYNPSVKVVDSTLGFVFKDTGFCAKSGLEFLDDLEKVPLEILESHAKNGDFERWFKDVLQDAPSSESLRAVRESNAAGEELRAKIVAVIATNYKSA